MNKQEYADFEKSVKDFFEREGINSLTQQSINMESDDLEYDPDTYFSWQPCDCCNRPCRLDDMTMLSIEE